MDESEIVEFYLNLCNADDTEAEAKTCQKYGIDEASLMFILEADLVESMMG